MLHDSETEKEILLGNRQLLGIFLVVVVLLAVAFGAGYKVGQGSHKSAPVSAAPETAQTQQPAAAGGVTATVPPDDASAHSPANTPTFPDSDSGRDESTAPPLGSTHRAQTEAEAAARQHNPEAAGPESPNLGRSVPTTPVADSGFAPHPGQVFLQVAAVKQEEAEGIAGVLRKKGLPAHAVLKPGQGPAVYRVLVGPIRDAADLNAKRASLMGDGFRHIFVQRY